MCRNITPLRGLEPPATHDEVVAAAKQYVRKVSSVTGPQMETEAFRRAVERVAEATADLLAELPPRRNPPPVLPPLRRRAASAG